MDEKKSETIQPSTTQADHVVEEKKDNCQPDEDDTTTQVDIKILRSKGESSQPDEDVTPLEGGIQVMRSKRELARLDPRSMKEITAEILANIRAYRAILEEQNRILDNMDARMSHSDTDTDAASDVNPEE